jgi:hypothetical protein
MKRLPIAKTEIKEIAEGNYCYADKTRFIKELVDDGHNYYFLSRPRRFGKSLFIDTLRAAFSGEKEYFKDLYLENNWDWNVKHPVIKISFGAGTVVNEEELNQHVHYQLRNNAKAHGVEIHEQFLPNAFHHLIHQLFIKYDRPVVVLIDEYDKPMLDNITSAKVYEIRDVLSSFYSVLKDASPYLRFVFLTGVSRFSKTSIFSKLNNITDISLVAKYADICGITQLELEAVFSDYLHNVDLETVKLWYDGYNFRGSNLYNPYDVLMFLWEKRYKPYWFETGTPTFLLKLIREKRFYIPSLENIVISETRLAEFDIDRIHINALLFQTGYLSIKTEEQIGSHNYFTLKIPNNEVRIGFNEFLLSYLFSPVGHDNVRSNLSQSIYKAITSNQPQELEQTFKSFFESIPHDWYRKNDIAHYEGFFSSMFYAFFAAQGFQIVAEDVTKTGSIDLSIITQTAVFIFEFKMKSGSGNALQQIKEKAYYKKYLSENKEIFLIGIEFDEEIKNISGFECERVEVGG